MWTAEVVLVCALNLLGRSAQSLPPIEFVWEVPADVTPSAEGYVRLHQRKIYLVATSYVFQAARQALDRCGNLMALRKIASVIIHEEVHLTRGADERSAYHAQLTTLNALGAGPGTGIYREVVLAMRHVKKQQSRQPDGLLAASKR